MTRNDPELGLVRLCRRCDEWWPLDAQFWTFDAKRPGWARCNACLDEKRRGRIRRHTLGIVAPCTRCLVVSSRSPECHGCASRFSGPLTVQKLADWGLSPTSGSVQ